MPRAATLLDGYLDWYITLKTLANDFYSAQHEIGYLEAASLIEYLIRTYGWEEFSTFYRDIHIKPGESQSDAIDAALQAHFSISFSELEQDFLSALKQAPVSPAWEDDVHWTVVYFDTLRRYQQLLDPSAYFRTAWLLDNKAMRERSIVAAYLRHPNTPQNLALETLFITASFEMETKQFTTALQILDVINSILDGIENGTKDPFSVSTMAADYLSISTSLQQQGYEVQRIEIDENVATTAVTGSAHPNLIELHFARSDGEWLLTPCKKESNFLY